MKRFLVILVFWLFIWSIVLCLLARAEENYHIMVEPHFVKSQSWGGSTQTFAQHKWSEEKDYIHVFLTKEQLMQLVDKNELYINDMMLDWERGIYKEKTKEGQEK